MDILKDKLLIGCLFVALIAASFLVLKNLPTPSTSASAPHSEKLNSLKEKANRIHEEAFKVKPVAEPIKDTSQTASPDLNESIAKMDTDLKKVIEDDQKAREAAFPPEPQSPPVALAPAAQAATAPAQTAIGNPPPSTKMGYSQKLDLINKVQGINPSTPAVVINKSRPRLGKNEWLVGPGAGADSTDLEPVLKNVIDGDILSVSPGTYEFSLSMPTGSVEIIGGEGVMFKFKKSTSLVMVNNISLKNIKLEFESEDNHVFISSPKLQLTFDNVTVQEIDQTITFNRGTKAIFKNSHFTGTNFVFFDLTEGEFENCFFEKGKTYLALYNSSKVKVTRSQLMNFSNNAVASHSYFARFEAENLKVSNGTSAFYGKFTNENTQVRESEFKALSYFTIQPETKINCTICQKTNIKN